MKKIFTALLLLVILLISVQNIFAQNPENWTSKQLIEPATLAQKITDKEDVPVIFSVGPGAVIPNSIDIGVVKEAANLDKLKKELSNLSRDAKIVIYCGCCPFEHCPNIRPAITVLQEMKFKNYRLLNLSHNVKADWIDKGYPVVKQ